MTITVSVIGSSGRMGNLILSLIEQDPIFSLHSALNSNSSLEECLGADLVIDVTRQEISQQVVELALAHGLRLLIGTSGWTKEKLAELRDKVLKSPATIAVVPNFSIGSVLASEFVAEASKYFDSIEIIETHHPKKLDAPSGTALFTSQLIYEAREGKALNLASEHAPLFNGVPIESRRIEGAHAEQEVLLTQPNEELFVRHTVSSHEAYSKGILLAMEKIMSSSGFSLGLLPLMRQ